jgi:putative transposase
MTQVTDHLNHSTWECKYHVVFTPKYRKKALYGPICKEFKDVLHRSLAAQKNRKIEEGHLMPDQVHMLISIPLKLAVASVAGS